MRGGGGSQGRRDGAARRGRGGRKLGAAGGEEGWGGCGAVGLCSVRECELRVGEHERELGVISALGHPFAHICAGLRGYRQQRRAATAAANLLPGETGNFTPSGLRRVDYWDVLTDLELLKEQSLEPIGVNPTPQQRVEVYWPEYREYFRGSMGTRIIEDGKMTCEYDDWDYEITDMKQRLWRAGWQPMEAPKHTELERL